AADDHDHQRGEQESRVLAWRDRLKGAADDTGNAGKSGAEGEDEHEDELDLHAGGGQDVAIVDAGAHDHADPRAIEREPHDNANYDRGDEDHEPHQRVLQVDRLAGGPYRRDERQLDRCREPVRGLNLVEIAAEGPEDQVSEYDRKSDRGHGLPQVLALHAAEDEDLQEDADQRHGEEGDDKAKDPGTGPNA